MRRVILIPVALVLGWWAISVMRSLPEKKVPAQFSGDSDATSPPSASRTTASVPPTTTVTAALAPVVSASKGSPAMPHPFEYPKELATYVDLQTKVFLSEAEKREKAELLHHEGLLRALGQSLLQATRDKEIIHQQDAAIDLLLESLMQGDNKVATEVLQKVVQDAQIEDTSMERGAREQLAGLKAEILYQWSANTPDIASSLSTWLPGPVSQKIWANVLKMQQSNLAESQAEARAKTH